MTRTEVFATYERVSAACAALREAGEKISGRRLREELGGGSMSTINPLMARWLREDADKRAAEDLLDEDLTAALAAFVQRCQTKGLGEVREQLAALEDSLTTTSEELSQAETHNVELDTELTACRQEKDDMAVQFERHRIAAQAREEQLEKRDGERALELRQMRTSYDQAKEVAASAAAKLTLVEARAGEAERLLSAAQSEQRALQKELADLHEQLRVRDREVADARARVEAKESAATLAREQLTDLRTQMQEERAERRAVVDKCESLTTALHAERLARSQADMRIANLEERAREAAARALANEADEEAPKGQERRKQGRAKGRDAVAEISPLSAPERGRPMDA